jgi:hypothetical protein
MLSRTIPVCTYVLPFAVFARCGSASVRDCAAEWKRCMTLLWSHLTGLCCRPRRPVPAPPDTPNRCRRASAREHTRIQEQHRSQQQQGGGGCGVEPEPVAGEARAGSAWSGAACGLAPIRMQPAPARPREQVIRARSAGAAVAPVHIG